MKKYVIGLTGQSGAGKSTVAAYLQKKGVPVIDADMYSRCVTSPGSPCLKELVLAFGDGILNSDKSLNRQVLADMAFENKGMTRLLNKITHPYIMEEIKKAISGLEGVIVLDAPTLFEAGAEVLCDDIWAVLASPEVSIDRIMSRDELTQAQAEMRIKAAKSAAFFEQKGCKIIWNDGQMDELLEEVDRLFEEIGGR